MGGTENNNPEWGNLDPERQTSQAYYHFGYLALNFRSMELMQLVRGDGSKPVKGREMASRRYNGWSRKGKWGGTVGEEGCSGISIKSLKKNTWNFTIVEAPLTHTYS